MYLFGSFRPEEVHLVRLGPPTALEPLLKMALAIASDLALPQANRQDFYRNRFFSKRREGVPEMGTKPLKALQGHRPSNPGSKNQVSIH